MLTDSVHNQSFSRQAFESSRSNRPTSSTAWLDMIREAALSRFLEVGFPSVKHEEWKYTNVAPLARIDFGSINPVDSLPPNFLPPAYPEAATNRLEFINGKLQAISAGIPDGIVVLDLPAAAADARFGGMVREHFGRQADYVSNSFTALNTAFASSGAFIYLPKNYRLKTPLHLSFVAHGDARPALFPRVLLVADEGGEATIIESYVGTSSGVYLTNAVIELFVKDNARLTHYKIQREGDEAYHISNTAAHLQRNSFYDSTAITLGSLLSRYDISVTMDAEGAECYVDGLYLVGTGQHTDTHSVIDHRKPHCSSHQLYKGILDGKSRAVFNGKIFVRHDAQKTDAMQTNKNLLLSNEARVDTKPQLEILADDVKCAHGAAVGQIEADELFYLETRGIHPELARNLLTYGFAEEVIEKIKMESIRRELDEFVLNRLNTRLEA